LNLRREENGFRKKSSNQNVRLTWKNFLTVYFYFLHLIDWNQEYSLSWIFLEFFKELECHQTSWICHYLYWSSSHWGKTILSQGCTLSVFRHLSFTFPVQDGCSILLSLHYHVKSRERGKNELTIEGSIHGNSPRPYLSFKTSNQTGRSVHRPWHLGFTDWVFKSNIYSSRVVSNCKNRISFTIVINVNEKSWKWFPTFRINLLLVKKRYPKGNKLTKLLLALRYE